MKRLRNELTYSNVMVTILAVLVIGGGTAYAATSMLPKNSVGTKQIKKGAITPAKLSTAAKAALTGPAGPKGATGPQGKEGSTGKEGPIGPSTLYSDTGAFGDVTAGAAKTTRASVTVPAGIYQVIASQTGQPSGGKAELDCYIYAGSSQEASFYSKMANETDAVVTGVATITVTASTEVSDQCAAFENTVIIPEPKIVALQVGALH